MPLEAGTKLGPYELVAPIGAGGMGEVYRANDTRLDRTVAIKVLPADLAESAERNARFQRGRPRAYRGRFDPGSRKSHVISVPHCRPLQ